MVALWSSRTNSSERPGNQGPKTEDSRSHGRHAQHNVQCRHQPPEPGFPPLLFQICGDQPLGTRSQCLCLPAHEEVKTSCFTQRFGYQKALQRSISGSQDNKKFILYFVGLYMLSFLKRGKDNIHIWLELPISFSCKFLEDLTELCSLFFSANALKPFLDFK